jgi:hypothetical protein
LRVNDARLRVELYVDCDAVPALSPKPYGSITGAVRCSTAEHRHPDRF